MNNVSISLIRSFLLLAQNKNMSETAKIVGRSQPAISQQIQKLEDILNVKLFDRNIRSIKLTDDGKRLLPIAEKLIELNDEIFNNMSKSTKSKTIRIGMPNDISQVMWEKCISDYKNKNPSVTIDITEDFSKNLFDLFEKNELDLIIATTMEKIKNKFIVHQSSRPIFWVANSPDLMDKIVINIISSPMGCVYREKMLNSIKLNNLEYNFSVISKSVGSTKNAVKDGAGTTALLQSAIDTIFKNQNNIHTSTEPNLENINIAVLCKNKNNNHYIKNLVNHILPVIKSL